MDKTMSKLVGWTTSTAEIAYLGKRKEKGDATEF